MCTGRADACAVITTHASHKIKRRFAGDAIALLAFLVLADGRREHR